MRVDHPKTIRSPSTPSAAIPQEAARFAEHKLILFKPSTIHGMGGFAKCKLSPGTVLLEYVGEKIDQAESVRRCEANNVFIFALNEHQHLDGDVAWNPARWLNHSCSPNAEAQLSNDRIWIVASRSVEAGEEITFNYGFDLENYRDYPCGCGSPDCVKFMVAEEFFAHVRAAGALRAGSAL